MYFISYTLEVNGSIGTSSGQTVSDDRVKHNEKNISGIDVVKQLQPKKYFKTIKKTLS